MTKCLIVEDEPIIAADLKCRLEEVGCAVAGIADSMPQAIRLLETEKPDLVFMDVNINGDKDGIETANVIRRKYDLPVIFVTAHADAETIQRAALTGPFGYVVKPYVNVNFRAQTEIALSKHQTEQRLRRSEAWLAGILSSLADAIIVTDYDGNIAFLNSIAEELTGWPAVEAAGKPLLEVFWAYHEKTGQPVMTPLEQIYQGEAIPSDPVTYRLIHRDQQRCSLVEARLSVNQNRNGIVGLIVCFSDINARQKAQEQQLQLQKTEVTAGLAGAIGRELSNSLPHTAESLQKLLCQVPDSLRCIARCAYLGVSDVVSIADQLTELGRSQSGKVMPLDLNALLLEVKSIWDKTDCTQWPMALDLYPALPPVLVEHLGCRDDIERLLREAKQAMPEGGEIYLGTELIDKRPAEYIARLTIRNIASRAQLNMANLIFDSYQHSRSDASACPDRSVPRVHRSPQSRASANTARWYWPGLSLRSFSRFSDAYRSSIQSTNCADYNEFVISFSVAD